MKLVRQVLGSWKVGKCCELKLHCEAGVMKATMSADLGSWVQRSQPKHSDADNRGHLSSRKRVGPSYLRKQEKRAAARAAAAAASSAEEETAQDKVEDAVTAPPVAPTTPVSTATPPGSKPARTCSKNADVRALALCTTMIPVHTAAKQETHSNLVNVENVL